MLLFVLIDTNKLQYVGFNIHEKLFIQLITIYLCSNMHDLTGFQRDLLYGIAAIDEPYGLAIKSHLEDYYETDLNHGRLYPNLDTLVEKALVEKGEYDRRTNLYTLTKRGRREMKARREWENERADL